jgi:hypothetical protein
VQKQKERRMSPRLNGNPNSSSSLASQGQGQEHAAMLARQSSSQAEAVALQVEASTYHSDNDDDDDSENFELIHASEIPPHHDDKKINAADTTATINTTTPVSSTPPRPPPPQSPVRQESALKRLGQRLRFRSRRRSLSAPPTLRRRHGHKHFRRRPLLEEHFRVVNDAYSPRHRPVVLPGVPRHEDNWARDLHDFFNLVVLVPVVALNMMNWEWDLLLNEPNKVLKDGIQAAWVGEYFPLFFATTAWYFLADLIWISIIPKCVRSPATIIQHHLATLLYIMIPYHIPEVQWVMGACMSVEVNTWLLIARRVFNKQGFPPWTIIDLGSFLSIRVKLISILFYITWLSIRCILYPYLLVDIYDCWVDYSMKVGTKWNWIVISFPLHGIFCLLNLKWTYDLLMSKIRYWRRRGFYNTNTTAAAAGGTNKNTNSSGPPEKDKGL